VIVRRTAAAAFIGLALIVLAPRVGEPDRTEAVAIGTLRMIVSGEQAYASANDGYFDTPAVASSSEHGAYQVQFHPGPKAARESGEQSPTAMTRFAVVAVPTDPMASRRRAFCADDRGTIYVTIGGTRPRIDSTRCLDTSSPLR
jgi:hypothetical protein